MDQANGLRELAAQGRLSRTPLQVMAVASGKGGVGKTNVTANLATLAARQGKRVLVMDADLGLANVELLFGLRPKKHLGDLLAGASMSEVLMPGPSGITLLPAGSGVSALADISSEQKLRLLASLDELEDRFDLVLIDVGAGIGSNVQFFVGAAQEVILVVSPEPTSLVDAYAALKVFSKEAGVTRFGVIVNPVVDELEARQVFPRLTGVASQFLSAKVRHLGFVPRDEHVHKAVVAQGTVVDLYPQSPSARAFVAIADRLFSGTTETPPLGSGLKFMWNRLWKESSAAAG